MRMPLTIILVLFTASSTTAQQSLTQGRQGGDEWALVSEPSGTVNASSDRIIVESRSPAQGDPAFSETTMVLVPPVSPNPQDAPSGQPGPVHHSHHVRSIVIITAAVFAMVIILAAADK